MSVHVSRATSAADVPSRWSVENVLGALRTVLRTWNEVRIESQRMHLEARRRYPFMEI